jgi:hypothetical protein
MSQLSLSGKSFEISKWAVYEAYQKVKANKGAPGVDGVSIAEFEADLKNNLYQVWNRMASGAYFPPPVKAVEIPKAGGGVRTLGVPTVADRVAQTVVAMELEKRVEPLFHPDLYGYRLGRSALDAVAACRRRCWKTDWVIDLDIQNFFSTPWTMTCWSKRSGRTPTRSGWCYMCNGGLLRRCNARTDTPGARPGPPAGFCGLAGAGEPISTLCV